MHMGDIIRHLDAWVQRPVFIATAWICACSNLIGQAEGAPTQPQTELIVKASVQPRRVGIHNESVLTTQVYSICEAHTGSIWARTSFA
jgi:hypothetical protein